MKRYYEVAIRGSSLRPLTYHAQKMIDRGAVVDVPLRSKTKKAVVLKETERPVFETLEIESVRDEYHPKWHLDVASFVSEYYFASIGEALGLFIPYSRNEADPVSPKSEKHFDMPVLSDDQQKAYNAIWSEECSLLYGVTGSGKTEIYITAIAQTLESGKSSILLMPEISLTPQMEKRLKRYFGDCVEIWHSKLSKKRKEEILERIENGTVKVVAGARSALFAPLKNLGLIIVDEEHDDSYKSMSRPRYHARDLAVYIGRMLGAKVCLASATPSLSSYMKYKVVRLKRPYIETKKHYRFVGGDTLTPELLEAIERNFKKKEQTLLFVPTRANFKYLWCESCGETHRCPYCSVGMSLHRHDRYLKCHYCNYTEPITESCSACGHSPLKSGRIGTREVIDTIKEHIPEARVEQFDRDAISTAGKLEKALKRVEEGECDIIVGTQMLSKGHDYPNITLSIITGLDYILGLSDYRAAERAVSLFYQIAGRSGRSKEAEVIVQSANEEYFRNYMDDYEKFLQAEKDFAKDLYPPYRSLARILISDRSDRKASEKMKRVVTILEKYSDIEIVGKGRAPIEKIAGKYRYSILLRAPKRVPLLRALHSIGENGVEIDMDPVEFS